MENMINNRQLPLLAFIILLTCDQDVMALNLTFYHDNVSWRKAADFCSKHNGFMESNASLVMKTIVDNNIEDVWFGKYEVYSQWAYIRGCFLINGHLTNFTIKHADEFQCQSLCENYTFYTVQDTQCFCTDDISTFERQADCNCSDCYKVREHQLATYTYVHSDKNHECITATCNYNQLKRAYRSCEHNFFVTCDDNRNLRYSYNNQTTASKECARNGSFIKWYQDDFCNSSSPIYPFWTSGRRLKHIFHLNKSGEIHDGVLHRCFKLQRDEDRMIEEDDEDCNEMFPFVCNFGWTEDDDDISINSTNNISPGEKVQSDKTAELIMQKVKFSNEQKAWKDAVNHCALKGGVLESNVTLLKGQDEFKTSNEDVWIGKFNTFTNWTYIHGCYFTNMTNGNVRHFALELSKTAELQCQKLCNKYKFYSIKGADCYCMANISSFIRSTNCYCVGCYKVWEHQLPNFGSAKGRDKCIATIKCEFGKFDRGYEECSKSYSVTCDNDAKLRGTYSNYKASAECEKLGSFIKWHPDNLCNSTVFPPHWTSGTRHEETFIVGKANFTENLQLDKCFILNDDGEEEQNNNCDTPRFFFCRFGDMIPPQKNALSDNSGNMIVGIVVSIVVIILITVVIIVFMFRRIHSRKLVSLSTIVEDEPSTSRIDSNTVNASYEQLNKTDKDNITHCQSYDQLNVQEADKSIKHNTRISREDESKYESIEEPIEKYNNALTAEYEQLEQTEIAKTTNVYDSLHYNPDEDADPTNARPNNIVSREDHRKYETSQTENETDTSVVPLEYEQLDITKTDTSTKAYDQLHVTHTAENESNNRPQLIVSGKEHTNNESSKDKKEFDSRIVSSEYENVAFLAVGSHCAR